MYYLKVIFHLGQRYPQSYELRYLILYKRIPTRFRQDLLPRTYLEQHSSKSYPFLHEQNPSFSNRAL